MIVEIRPYHRAYREGVLRIAADTALNAAAIRLYKKTGLQLLGSRPTRLWESLLPNTVVVNLLYGRRFIPVDATIGRV